MTVSLAFRVAKLLREARDYISDRNHWTKGRFGASDWGRPMDEDLLTAPRVCSLGALGKAAGLQSWMDEPVPLHAREAAAHLANAMGNDVPAFNDREDTTHEDVLAAFDLAIEDACKIVRREVEEKSND